MDTSSLWVGLMKHFAFERVDTIKQREEAFRIRFEVYCREFGFERVEDHPDRMERDPYDDAATHCLLRHRATRVPAGCVRVIFPRQSSENDDLLPLEQFCGASLHDGPLHPDRLPRDQICEISRLAVPAIFRRRSGEKTSTIGNPDADLLDSTELRAYPLIGIAMFIAAANIVRIAERQHVFAMMEPKLARMLGKFGIQFEQIGNIIDYHGPRAPFYLDRLKAENDGRSDMHILYEMVHGQLLKPHSSQVSMAQQPGTDNKNATTSKQWPITSAQAENL